jgi:hypothetical protein
MDLSRNTNVLGSCPAVRKTMLAITPADASVEELMKLAEGVSQRQDELRIELWQCAESQLSSIKDYVLTKQELQNAHNRR